MKKNELSQEYGWVVQASVARGGEPDSDLFISNDSPVGLGPLQRATWFKIKQEALSMAHWQLGNLRFACRNNRNKVITLM